MTSSAYGDPSVGTSGPSITLPLAGVYEVTHGAFMYMSAAAVGYMSYAIGATAAVDADALIDGLISGSNVSRTRIKTVGAVVIKAQYKASASQLNVQDRFLRIIPRTVG